MSKMVFVLLLAIFLGSVESRAAEKIRISVSGGYNMIFLSSGVAQHRGFFKDEGLDADIIVIGAGATRALIKASRFIRDNREEAVKVLIAWGKAKPEHAYAAYDSTVAVISQDGGIPEDGLKFLIEQAKRDVKMRREISLSEIADFGILREIQKELGVR